MYKIISFLIAATMFISCYSNETTPSDDTSNETATTEVTPKEKSAERKIGENPVIEAKETKEEAVEGKLVTYESCATYAAATDYAFVDEKGERIMVRANHFENDKFPNPILPENMKESGEGLEGPPGANPKLVGKQFKLVYDEKEERVLKVVLVEG